jgi:hypothetical protein
MLVITAKLVEGLKPVFEVFAFRAAFVLPKLIGAEPYAFV